MLNYTWNSTRQKQISPNKTFDSLYFFQFLFKPFSFTMFIFDSCNLKSYSRKENHLFLKMSCLFKTCNHGSPQLPFFCVCELACILGERYWSGFLMLPSVLNSDLSFPQTTCHPRLEHQLSCYLISEWGRGKNSCLS